MKTTFNSKYGTKNKVKSVPGARTKIEYQLVIDDDGIERLKPCGMTDLHEEIQSHASSVDINLILKKYQAGDRQALEKMQGFYADVADLPGDLLEIMNMNLKGQQLFDSMLPDVKQVFGDSYMQFLAHPERIANLKEKYDNNVPDVMKKEVTEDGE